MAKTDNGIDRLYIWDETDIIRFLMTWESMSKEIFEF